MTRRTSAPALASAALVACLAGCAADPHVAQIALGEGELCLGSSLQVFPGLEDSGDLGIPFSPDATEWPFPDEGKNFVFRHFSWFERASVLNEKFATTFPTDEQMKQLADVISDLKRNRGLTVVVRQMTTPSILKEAMARCSSVYVLAHGSDVQPFVGLSYDPEMGTLDGKFPDAGRDLEEVGLFSCRGTAAAKTLSAAGGSTRYFSPVVGDEMATKIVQKLVEHLRAVRDAPAVAEKAPAVPEGAPAGSERVGDQEETVVPRVICILAATYGDTKMCEYPSEEALVAPTAPKRR